MDPATASRLADALLGLHAGIVAFNVAMPPAILLGAWRGWAWVRHRGLRALHLVSMAVVAAQALLGELCFLTHWESALRRLAGEAGYGTGFVEAWLGRLLYVEVPLAALLPLYVGWALLSLGLWWWVPPARAPAQSVKR